MSDLNKRIAELRGEKRCTPDGRVYYEKSAGGSTWYIGGEPTPYSTDIRCAMELWDEMIDGEGLWVLELKSISKVDHQVGFVWDDSRPDDIREFVGETPCECICNAWLEWVDKT